jgi:hypothetical protein
MDDEKELVKVGAEAFFKPFSDLIEKLAGPLAQEVGETFGDAARVFRFKRAVKLPQKVKKFATEAGFEPSAVRPKLLLPLLDHASVEDDEDLHDRWAALLANSANLGGGLTIHASFPEILAQLSSKDVALLDLMQRHVEDNLAKHYPQYPQVSSQVYLIDIGTWRTVLRLYADLGLSKCNASVLLDLARSRQAPEANTDYSEFRLVFDNLLRLGLIREDQVNSTPRPVVHLTALGYNFVLACRVPRVRANRAPPLSGSIVPDAN